MNTTIIRETLEDEQRSRRSALDNLHSRRERTMQELEERQKLLESLDDQIARLVVRLDKIRDALNELATGSQT